jgi:serine/threonine protein kinase
MVQLLGNEIISNRGIQEAILLLEYCSGGHLFELLSTRNGERLPLSRICTIFGQLLLSLKPFHESNPPVSHRDLKLENILFSSDGTVKLCDFGSCVIGNIPIGTNMERTNEEERIDKETTPNYRAPEMIDLYMRDILTEKTDIWALACILYTLCYLIHPFQDVGGLGIVNARITCPNESHIPEDMKVLILLMFDMDPEARPSISQIIDAISAISKNQPLPSYELSQEALQKRKERIAMEEFNNNNNKKSNKKSPVVARKQGPLDNNSVAARRLAAKRGTPLPDPMQNNSSSINSSIPTFVAPQEDLFAQGGGNQSNDFFQSNSFDDNKVILAAVSSSIEASSLFDTVSFDDTAPSFESPSLNTQETSTSSFSGFEVTSFNNTLAPSSVFETPSFNTQSPQFEESSFQNFSSNNNNNNNNNFGSYNENFDKFFATNSATSSISNTIEQTDLFSATGNGFDDGFASITSNSLESTQQPSSFSDFDLPPIVDAPFGPASGNIDDFFNNSPSETTTTNINNNNNNNNQYLSVDNSFSSSNANSYTSKATQTLDLFNDLPTPNTTTIVEEFFTATSNNNATISNSIMDFFPTTIATGRSNTVSQPVSSQNIITPNKIASKDQFFSDALNTKGNLLGSAYDNLPKQVSSSSNSNSRNNSINFDMNQLNLNADNSQPIRRTSIGGDNNTPQPRRKSISTEEMLSIFDKPKSGVTTTKPEHDSDPFSELAMGGYGSMNINNNQKNPQQNNNYGYQSQYN